MTTLEKIAAEAHEIMTFVNMGYVMSAKEAEIVATANALNLPPPKETK
jgi:hypothetical protein